MQGLDRGARYAGNPAENYQRYFVPAIGHPIAVDLVSAARLRDGERVLDVACGTGAVTRLAREAVGARGQVTGLDLNPGMIEVARAYTPAGQAIDWVEAPAEDLPFSDDGFDVVFCGMGLQFFADREAGLREMHRVLCDRGRAVFNLPGPAPEAFEIFEHGLAQHVGLEAAGFASAVFSLHDPGEIRELVHRAGFEAVQVDSTVRPLSLPPPQEFLWQYVNSTPLAAPVMSIGADRRAALEREVCEGWRALVEDEALVLELRITTVSAST